MNDYLLAEDATQDIFIKAYQGLRKFNEKALFSTWLYRIAFNHCQDLLKKRHNQKCESLEELSEREGERFEALLFSSQDTSVSVEQIDLARRVLSQVSDRYRSIIILREVQGLTYNELAEVFDCSIDSVKAKLRRARQELQEKIRHIIRPLNV